MDILDTETDGHKFLINGIHFGKDSVIDTEAALPVVNGMDDSDSEEEDFSGVGMRVCFKAGSRFFDSNIYFVSLIGSSP